MSAGQSWFLGTLFSATSVSITVQVLKEMNQLHSREATTILGAAVLDDVLVVLLLATLMSSSAQALWQVPSMVAVWLQALPMLAPGSGRARKVQEVQEVQEVRLGLRQYCCWLASNCCFLPGQAWRVGSLCRGRCNGWVGSR